MEKNLDISWMTILRVFFIGFLFYVVFLVRDVVIWFFFALIISILLQPAINFLKRLKFPKILAVVLVYSSIFGLLGLLIFLTAPIFISEIQQLSLNIPIYFERVNPVFQGLGISIAENFNDFIAVFISGLQESSLGIARSIIVFFGGLASSVIIFTFAFYISLEEKGPEKVLSLLVPKKYEEFAISIFERSQIKVAGWFGARILACVFVGIASAAVLYLLGVRYAFTLSLISGILTFIPFIGPLITSLIVLVFVGASNSLLLAGYIIIAFLIIQQIENSVITPLLMKQFLDLPPILVLVALLIGGIIFGLLGMIFFVPIFGIAYEFSRNFLQKKKAEEMLVAD